MFSKKEMESQPLVQATPVQTNAPSPTPTSAPTPAPTPSPTPAPKITDAWYVQRTEEMRKWMKAYGSYASDEALDEAVANMEIDPDKPMVALSFDDGPMEGISDEIVEILQAHNARATFFVRGARCKFDVTAGLLQKILGAGCEIGNHTWRHELLTNVSSTQAISSIQRCNDDVFAATGYTIRTLRPPGGKCDYQVERIAKRQNMAIALWAQSGNVHEHDPEKIAENVELQIVNGKELEDGDIILLHDTKPWMVEAVKLIVPRLQAKGYQLVTVQELINLSDRGFVPGEVYHKRIETPEPEE